MTDELQRLKDENARLTKELEAIRKVLADQFDRSAELLKERDRLARKLEEKETCEACQDSGREILYCKICYLGLERANELHQESGDQARAEVEALSDWRKAHESCSLELEKAHREQRLHAEAAEERAGEVEKTLEDVMIRCGNAERLLAEIWQSEIGIWKPRNDAPEWVFKLCAHLESVKKEAK